MYVESKSAQDTQAWIDVVHSLRYKDYQLVAPAGLASKKAVPSTEVGTLREVNTVREFAAEMQSKGLLPWWRVSMGFVHGE